MQRGIAISGVLWLLTLAPLGAETFLADVSNAKFTLYTDPNTGLELKLGGFSGIANVPGDETGTVFHVITDRGPTVDPAVGKAFPAPDFPVSLLTVRLLPQGKARIVQVVSLRKPNGEPIHGVPGVCHEDEDPIVALDGSSALPRDPDALDAEGLAVTPGGLFLVSEEYLPSISIASQDGTVFLRLAPRGSICGGEEIPTFDLLPGVYSKRVTNRGFEAIAVGNGFKVYTMPQRPLANPDSAASSTSRNIRLLELDLPRFLLGDRSAMRQLIYLTEPNSRQDRVYASDMFALGGGKFLVSERRTDKVFLVDLEGATDVTGLEDADGRLLSDPTRTLEQLSPVELASLGVQPVAKTAVLSGLIAIDATLEKVEGITVAGDKLVLCPDNDFNLLSGDFGTNPATLIFQDPPNLPRIVTLPLPPGVPAPSGEK